MHLSSLFAAFLLAATASAEVDLAKILALQKELPECSSKCIQTTAAEYNCTVIDLACQCSNMQPIIQDVTPCFVRAGCRLEDIANAAKTSFDICQVVAEGMGGNSTTENPALPKTTPIDVTDDAISVRGARTGALVLVAMVAGAVML